MAAYTFLAYKQPFDLQPLLYINRFKFTYLFAFSAHNTRVLFYYMRFFNLTAYRVNRAAPFTQRTSDTLLLVDRISKQRGTALRGTLFMIYMILIFIPEIPDGGQHGVWGGLPQSAQGAVFYLNG